jgi:hypothetical protein
MRVTAEAVPEARRSAVRTQAVRRSVRCMDKCEVFMIMSEMCGDGWVVPV